MIRHLYPLVPVTFALINRSRSVRLADEIDEAELRIFGNEGRNAAAVKV